MKDRYCNRCGKKARLFKFRNLSLCWWHWLLGKLGFVVWFTQQQADENAGIRGHIYDHKGNRLNESKKYVIRPGFVTSQYDGDLGLMSLSAMFIFITYKIISALWERFSDWFSHILFKIELWARRNC